MIQCDRNKCLLIPFALLYHLPRLIPLPQYPPLYILPRNNTEEALQILSIIELQSGHRAIIIVTEDFAQTNKHKDTPSSFASISGLSYTWREHTGYGLQQNQAGFQGPIFASLTISV